MKKKIESKGIILSDFKIYHNIYGTGLKGQHTDPWSRVESPQRNPHLYDQLVFAKGPKNGARVVSSRDSIGKTGKPHAKNLNGILI